MQVTCTGDTMQCSTMMDGTHNVLYREAETECVHDMRMVV